ncbi:cytidine deaminase [Flavobacteria bacterium BAL38]|uniref:cytidine deaminase n=1 Tax=unclassified Flavobacterium TaxID=196869 RepID=UPI0000F399A2|nr:MULTISPECIES: cytidine deaminase [unclassified Flavobacterium]EAZ96392.1 cytidine deaminase [Flavobacteria bacterium BAL38]MQP52185.1 cytidine deaminase [Flavobacterium sp. LMO9]MQP62055.1 cytidine deaminase [Flavobacterium sp. LMO6]
MKQININSVISILTVDELSQVELDLKNQAFEARSKAYAPYSKFTVGAAILLDNGIIVQGSNQENAAYPSGLCAERVAIFYAGSTYPDAKIVKMFITASPQDRELTEPIPPCGSCRQVIAEYEFKQDIPIEIFFMGAVGEIYKSDSLKNLLPFVFDKNHL